MAETNTDEDQVALYELACEVTGDVSPADKNGRLVSTAPVNSTANNNNYLMDSYVNLEDAVRFGAVSATQISESPIRSQLDKKRAARIAQHGAAPGDRSGGGGEFGKGCGGVAGEDGTVYDTISDVTLVDNANYANVTMPASAPLTGIYDDISNVMVEGDSIVCDSGVSDNYENVITPASTPLATSSPSSAAAADAEPECTSINDFTLIDNDIYNYCTAKARYGFN